MQVRFEILLKILNKRSVNAIWSVTNKYEQQSKVKIMQHAILIKSFQALGIAIPWMLYSLSKKANYLKIIEISALNSKRHFQNFCSKMHSMLPQKLKRKTELVNMYL